MGWGAGGQEGAGKFSLSVPGQGECGKPPTGGGAVVVPLGQAVWLEGTVVIIEVLSQDGVETGDSKQDLENDRGSSIGNIRSLVLRNKMYQEGKGEPTGGKRCLLRTRAPLAE